MNVNEFSIKYTGRRPFEVAVQMAFVSEYEREAKPVTINGYKIIDNVMYLSRYSDKPDIIKFPYPFNMKQVTDFIYGWLENSKPTGEEPDTDGSTKHGWVICNYENAKDGQYFYDAPINKQFSNDWGLLFCVKPVWLVYGK